MYMSQHPGDRSICVVKNGLFSAVRSERMNCGNTYSLIQKVSFKSAGETAPTHHKLSDIVCIELCSEEF